MRAYAGVYIVPIRSKQALEMRKHIRQSVMRGPRLAGSPFHLYSSCSGHKRVVAERKKLVVVVVFVVVAATGERAPPEDRRGIDPCRALLLVTHTHAHSFPLPSPMLRIQRSHIYIWIVGVCYASPALPPSLFPSRRFLRMLGLSRKIPSEWVSIVGAGYRAIRIQGTCIPKHTLPVPAVSR